MKHISYTVKWTQPYVQYSSNSLLEVAKSRIAELEETILSQQYVDENFPEANELISLIRLKK